MTRSASNERRRRGRCTDQPFVCWCMKGLTAIRVEVPRREPLRLRIEAPEPMLRREAHQCRGLALGLAGERVQDVVSW